MEEDFDEMDIEDLDKEDLKVDHVNTGIEGFDSLFTKGIPKGATVMVSGGTGTGKTIFNLQVLANHASNGKKCLYMSFEESERNLLRHMNSFGWDPLELIKSGNFHINRYSPFVLRREVGSNMAREKGEVRTKIGSTYMPQDFEPDFLVIDSITSVLTAFRQDDMEYRKYVEELFRYLEDLDCTTFLISETEQDPERFSPTGVEEFLSDGVIVLYNIKKQNVRERAIEVLKMRGEEHQRKIVAMNITENGMKVYPDQEVFSVMD